jgi:ArsR family transcriptional regulator, repressor of sdpIR and other operons
MNILFKALNDPTRREILEMLQKKDMTAGEIADRFDNPSLASPITWTC